MQHEEKSELAGRHGMAQAEIKWAWCLNPFDDTDVIRHPVVNAIVKNYKKKHIFSDQE